MKANKKIIGFVSIAIILSASFIFIINRQEIFQNKKNVHFGEIKIENSIKEKNKNEDTYTIEDGFGNKYKKVGFINEGIMFDMPTGFAGKRIGNTYYIYPSEKNKENFSTMLAFRFFKNGNWEKRNPEYAKDKLMDSTKDEVKYVSTAFSKPYNLSHLNRGKAKKMDNVLIYEEANTSKYSDTDDPTKVLDMFTSFTYIPLNNTNVEVTAISPFETKDILNEIQESVISSLSEYNPLEYKDKKILDKEINSRYISTKLSSAFSDIKEKDGFILGDISNDIFSKDYGMFITIGVIDKNEYKTSSENISNEFLKKIYSSWFYFSSQGAENTSLTYEEIGDTKIKIIDTHRSFYKELKIFTQAETGISEYNIPSPSIISIHTVDLKDNKVGFIALRHSVYNKDIAENIVDSIAKSTHFK